MRTRMVGKVEKGLSGDEKKKKRRKKRKTSPSPIAAESPTRRLEYFHLFVLPPVFFFYSNDFSLGLATPSSHVHTGRYL